MSGEGNNRTTGRSRRRLWAGGLIALTGGVVLAATAAAPLGYFQRNHARYLVNAHRYADALEQWRAAGGEGDGTAGDTAFAGKVLDSAEAWYGEQPLAPGDPARARWDAVLDGVIAAHPELAPRARRMRLRALALREGPTTATLAAARAILASEYDPDAAWWAARALYNPLAPLAVPEELRARRAEALASAETPDGDASEEARRQWLAALLELEAHDRAAAAAALDAVADRATLPWGAERVHGLALLRAGRAEAAVGPLLQFHSDNPGHGETLALLAEAWLKAGAEARALEALDRLRALDPGRIGEVLTAAWPVAPGTEPLAALATGIGRPGPLEREVFLWHLLGRLAPEGEARRAIEEAGVRLAEERLDAAALAALAQVVADRPGEDAARAALTARLRAAEPGGTGLEPARRAVREWRAGVLASGAGDPPGHQPLGLFLAGARTAHARVTLPAGTRLATVQAQGFPAGEAWPVIHVELGRLSQATVYLEDSRVRARPVLLLLPAALAEPAEFDLAVSLLNPGREGEARQVLVTGIGGFGEKGAPHD